MTRRDVWGHKGTRQNRGSSILEEIGRVYTRQPQGVPEEAGFWANQVPPTGTRSAHEQYPGESHRKR
eukprot:8957122-Heterocapsa_arctica.AAC.1